jgi:hypothetical protein
LGFAKQSFFFCRVDELSSSAHAFAELGFEIFGAPEYLHTNM